MLTAREWIVIVGDRPVELPSRKQDFVATLQLTAPNARRRGELRHQARRTPGHANFICNIDAREVRNATFIILPFAGILKLENAKMATSVRFTTLQALLQIHPQA